MGTRYFARVAFAGCFVLIFAFVLWGAYFGYGAAFPRARLFPLAIGIPALILALTLFQRKVVEAKVHYA